MRFMAMVKATKESEAGAPPDPALMAAIGKLTEESMTLGAIIEVGGLLPSSTGARVRTSGGKVTVTDGPFTEFKELIGGYAILEARSLAEAIEYGRRFMQVHLDVLGADYEGECEIRPFGHPGGCGR
jgi:hypothetical protein